jgi:hypothetical protein
LLLGLDTAVQLSSKHAHQAQSEALFRLLAFGNDTDPVILDLEAETVSAGFRHRDIHASGSIIRKGVLECVGHDFIHNQTAGYRAVDRQRDIAGVYLALDLSPDVLTLRDAVHDSAQVRVHRDALQIIRAVQVLMHQSHRVYAALTVLDKRAHALGLTGMRLQAQQTADDLHVVLHAMMNFLQQSLLLAIALFELAVRITQP